MGDMNVELVDHMGTDLTVVNAARVSFSKRKFLTPTPKKGSIILSPGEVSKRFLKFCLTIFLYVFIN